MNKNISVKIKDNTEGKELIDKIYKSFYKKIAIENLLNNASNEHAIASLGEKYADLNVEWQSYMDKMGEYILGQYYGFIDYSMNINFMRNVVDMTIDDTQPDYSSLVLQMQNTDKYKVLNVIDEK